MRLLPIPRHRRATASHLALALIASRAAGLVAGGPQLRRVGTRRPPAIALPSTAAVSGFSVRGYGCHSTGTVRNGRTIRLALIRHLASRPKQRLGSLFFNPGAPGVSGVYDVREHGGEFDAAGDGRFERRPGPRQSLSALGEAVEGSERRHVASR
jgi:hypothetical protein